MIFWPSRSPDLSQFDLLFGFMQVTSLKELKGRITEAKTSVIQPNLT